MIKDEKEKTESLERPIENFNAYPSKIVPREKNQMLVSCGKGMMVTIRSKPSNDSKIIAYASDGDKLTIVSPETRENGYIKVITDQGQYWVLSKNLKGV